MVLALAEELREKYRHQQQEEISRLQVIIDGLQYAIRTQDSHAVRDSVEVDSDGKFEIEYEEADELTLVTMAPSVRKRPSLEMSIAILPRIPISFQTPITPPESPSHSLFIPRVVVPISNAITPTSIPKFVIQSQDRGKDRDMSSSTLPEPSEKSSVSPPTHPFRFPVFSPPYSGHLAKPEASVSSDIDEMKLEEHAASQVSIVEQQLPVNQSSIVELEAQDNEDGNEALPDSPSIQWNPLSPSALSSRRSSIVSIDTLCGTSDSPSKRFSIVSYNSDIFDSVPALPFEIPSRRASLSDPWHITSIPPETDGFMIPLPPSPSSLATASDSTPPSLLSLPITSRIPFLEFPSTSNLNSTSSVISSKSSIGLIEPLPMTHDAEDDEDNRRSTTVVETASCIVTGFLVGAFVTLFLFSTQRKTLLYLT
jgi:hypothetical protein